MTGTERIIGLREDRTMVTQFRLGLAGD